MQIELTAEQTEFIRRAIETGRVKRSEEAVQQALVLWVERERLRDEILAEIDEAEASLSGAEGIVITRASMRELAEDVKRRGRSRLNAEKKARR
jgi:Arc/MetJ-type ribon-helix-helix transcriptional regulator